MKLEIFVQAMVLGLLQGGVYALIAAGLTLIYGVMKLVNFAHGDFVTIGMYLAFFAYNTLGLDPYLSFALIVPVIFLVSVCVHATCIWPALHHPPINQTLVTIGISTVVIGIIQYVWGTNMLVIRPSYGRWVLDLWDIRISFTRLVAFIVAMLSSGVLWWFMQKTKAGMAIRAVSMNSYSAELMGVKVRQVHMLTFAIGLIMASLAGMLLSSSFFLSPSVGTDLFLLPAFVIVVLGTMGNFLGALVGGLVIGLVEALGGVMFGSSLRQLASLSIFVLIMLFMPKGLFGGRTR